MNDLDMLYDYYTSVNLASGGYASLACRIKDDKLETMFKTMAAEAIIESKATAGLVIKYGGQLY